MAHFPLDIRCEQSVSGRQWRPAIGHKAKLPSPLPASAGRPPRGCGGAAQWCVATHRGTDMTRGKGRASAKPRIRTTSGQCPSFVTRRGVPSQRRCWPRHCRGHASDRLAGGAQLCGQGRKKLGLMLDAAKDGWRARLPGDRQACAHFRWRDFRSRGAKRRRI
jgi:hypothetical protein